MAEKLYRKLNVTDLKLVLGMENDFRLHFIVEESARQFLLDSKNWLFACIEQDKIIGFAYGYELNRLDSKGNMLYIHEVGVLPQYHRQGIGRSLIEKLAEITAKLGICRFFLSTQKSNLPACALYEKCGGQKNPNQLDDDVLYYFNNEKK